MQRSAASGAGWTGGRARAAHAHDGAAERRGPCTPPPQGPIRGRAPRIALAVLLALGHARHVRADLSRRHRRRRGTVPPSPRRRSGACPTAPPVDIYTPHQLPRHGGEDPHLRRHPAVDQGASTATAALANVTLGFDNIADYEHRQSLYFGCITGRYANRIAWAGSQLNGQTYQLPINNPPNSLHGGDRRLRQARLGRHPAGTGTASGPGAPLHQPRRRPGLPGQAGQPGHLHAHQPQRDPHGLPGQADRQQQPQDDHQPDQPRLLEPGRRGLERHLRPQARPSRPATTRRWTRP